MLKVRTFRRRDCGQVAERLKGLYQGQHAVRRCGRRACRRRIGGSMRRGFIGGVRVLLTSCGPTAQVAMAPPAQDAAGKQFNPPPAGMAAIYFYNPLTTGPVINVFEGPIAIGQLGPMTWMRIETSPGWHAM